MVLLLCAQVEDYSHQLSLREKEMDNCRTREDAGNLRYSSLSSHPHKVSTTSLLTGNEGAEKKKNDSECYMVLLVHHGVSSPHSQEDTSGHGSPLEPR